MLANHPAVPLSPSSLGWALLAAALGLLGLAASSALELPLRFAYNCFVKPFFPSAAHGSSEQKDRLDLFYKGQADVYDSTRAHLLKGRETMLQLLAAHLKAQPTRPAGAGQPAKPKIWVDIGGGTGWNIEKM